MDGFGDLLLTFPTVLFVALSVLSLMYWGLVIVGAADLDILDGVDGAAAHGDGVIEGAVDAATGAAKGGASALSDVLATLGLSKVPITVSSTVFGLLGFFLSLTTHSLLGDAVPAVVAGLIATVVSVVGAGALTSVIVRPLGRFFAASETKRGGGRALLGRTVRITIDVDAKGGQARTSDEVIVSVRCAGHTLARGEEAVIMDIGDDGVFLVEPMHTLMPSTADAFERLRVESQDSAVPETVPASQTKS